MIIYTKLIILFEWYSKKMENFIFAVDMSISYGVMVYILLKFMSEFYSLRYEKKMLYFIVWIVCIILLVLVYQTKLPLVKGVYLLSFIFVLSQLLFKPKSIKAMIVYGSFFFLYLFIIDTLSVVIFSAITQSTMETIINEQNLLLISGVGNSILLLGSYRFFIQLLKQHRIELIAFQQNVFLIILAIFELVLSNYIVSLSQAVSYGGIMVIIIMAFLAFDFYLIYLFESISKKNHLEQEVALAKQQGIMQNNYFATIEAQYDDSQRLIHDMKNHLLTLENMYRHSDDERGDEKAYTEMIYEKMDQLGSRFKCDNRVLTIIINDKIRKSEELGITFKTEIENLNLDFMSSFDMTTIFSNLLDNAIEACEEVEREKRMIHVRMYRFNDFIILNIKNTTEKPPVKEKNRFSSTKGQGHFGLGLTNVQKSIEHYEGTVEYEYKEKLFYTKVIIPHHPMSGI